MFKRLRISPNIIHCSCHHLNHSFLSSSLFASAEHPPVYPQQAEVCGRPWTLAGLPQLECAWRLTQQDRGSRCCWYLCQYEEFGKFLKHSRTVPVTCCQQIDNHYGGNCGKFSFWLEKIFLFKWTEWKFMIINDFCCNKYLFICIYDVLYVMIKISR